MSIAFEISVIVFLVLLNGWFAMSELAIVSARKARLTSRVEGGDKGAKVAIRLGENPGRFLSSVQIGITLIGILSGAYSGATLAEQLTAWITTELPSLAVMADVISMAIVVGIITYATLIVGELVPKQIALANPESIAAWVSRPMAMVAKFASPLVWLLEHSTSFTLRLMGVNKSDENTVTEEEVKAMITEGTETGIFKPEEKELIWGVMRFGDRKIRAIMTPRNEVKWLDVSWDSGKIFQSIRESRHSRFPVCNGRDDEIIGVVQAKDMLDSLLAKESFDIKDLIKPIEVICDNAPALQVLGVLKQSEIHMALVVDEYGAVEGIVTATDILSSIIGSLSEHGEEYEGGIFQREDGSWLIDGSMAIDIATEKTGCRIMSTIGNNFTTVAGFILYQFHTIPKAGDCFEKDDWHFEVIDMDGRRIDKVILSRINQDEQPGT